MADHGSGHVLRFQVNQNGDVAIAGALNRAGPHTLNNTTGSGDLLRIQSSAATRVLINNAGHGDFALGGLQTATVSSNPDGSRSGGPGDMVLWNSGGTNFYWCVCIGGTDWRIVELLP